jgi:hypothetical protein
MANCVILLYPLTDQVSSLTNTIEYKTPLEKSHVQVRFVDLDNTNDSLNEIVLELDDSYQGSYILLDGENEKLTGG